MLKEGSKKHPPLLREQHIAEGDTVLVRVDFNVPIADGRVDDDFRIERSIPTIAYLQEKKAKIILVSHIENDVGSTLEPVSRLLQDRVPHTFIPTLERESIREGVDDLNPGDVILLENTRSDPGEKENSEPFAAMLASFVDLFVNDAFSVSHREHASVVGIPKHVRSCAGLLLEEEITSLETILHEPSRPFVFIMGGAKFDTKLPLIEKFLDRADAVFVGGALANDIYEARGLEVGQSRVSDDVDVSDIAHHEKLSVPDHIVAEDQEGKSSEKSVEEVTSRERILDIGKEGVDKMLSEMSDARLIVWNGPFGDYEHCHGEGTEHIARGLSRYVAEGVRVIIGGGDTLAVISEIGLRDGFSFISTGGGAMLRFLSEETLPGIDALLEGAHQAS